VIIGNSFQLKFNPSGKPLKHNLLKDWRQAMEERVKKAIFQAVENEPFAKMLNIKLVSLDLGQSTVEMIFDQESMGNIYNRAHGGAIFSLIDEAFETASQTHGTIAVALNVNIQYITSPETGNLLRANAKEISGTRKTATYEIKVHDQDGRLIAMCQALAYRTGKPIPFI
jgi:acyl-CoA thioesterase